MTEPTTFMSCAGDRHMRRSSGSAGKVRQQGIRQCDGDPAGHGSRGHRATFFRHFPSKEAVLFQDYDTQLEWLAEALAQRPASESLFDAVLASVAQFPHDVEVVRQAAMARSS